MLNFRFINQNKYFWLFLNILPGIITVIYVLVWSVNVPYLHDWIFLDHIINYPRGEWLANFFRPQNGQRNFFPQIIYLLIYNVFDFNTLYFRYINLILIFLLYLIIWKIFKNSLNISLKHFVPVSWLFFSLIQYGNILISWQLSLFLGVTTGIFALYFLNKQNLMSFVVSIILSTISVFSFGNGLVILPIGFLLLLLNKQKYINIITWIVYSIITLLLYFTNYSSSGVAISLNLFHNFIFFANLLTTTIFMPLGKYGGIFYSISAVLGTLIIIFTSILIIRLFKSKLFRKNHFIFILFLYSLGILVQITVARSGNGYSAAFATQYTSFVILFFIFLYALYLINLPFIHNNNNKLLLLKKGLSGFFVTYFIGTILIGYSFGILMGPYIYGRLTKLKYIVDTYDYQAIYVKNLIQGQEPSKINNIIDTLVCYNKSVVKNNLSKNALLLPFIETTALRNTKNLNKIYIKDSTTFELVNNFKKIYSISIQTIFNHYPNYYQYVTLRIKPDNIDSTIIFHIPSISIMKKGQLLIDFEKPLYFTDSRKFEITIINHNSSVFIPLFNYYYRGPSQLNNGMVPELEINTPSRLRYYYITKFIRNNIKLFF